MSRIFVFRVTSEVMPEIHPKHENRLHPLACISLITFLRGTLISALPLKSIQGGLPLKTGDACSVYS